MTGARVTPARDPFSEAMADIRYDFQSDIFNLDYDNENYVKLMNRILNPDEMVDIIEKTKNWTKEGAVLVHVEWVEVITPEVDKERY